MQGGQLRPVASYNTAGLVTAELVTAMSRRNWPVQGGHRCEIDGSTCGTAQICTALHRNMKPRRVTSLLQNSKPWRHLESMRTTRALSTELRAGTTGRCTA